jgi:hypothetical protein
MAYLLRCLIVHELVLDVQSVLSMWRLTLQHATPGNGGLLDHPELTAET